MEVLRSVNGTFMKGNKINQGRVWSSEQREKQSETLKGRRLSDEHKERIRAGVLKAVSEGKNIGNRKGSIPWNKGMRRKNGDPIPVYIYPELSEEAKKNRSEARKGKHYSSKTEFKKGFTPWNTGKPCSEKTLEKLRGRQRSVEAREKMSRAKKGIRHSAETIKKMLSRRTPTSLEIKLQGIIEKHGLPYKFVGDGSFMIGRKNPDFININGEKIAIEVYARYYKLRHAETLQEWKEEREKVFKEYGWSVIFFDETQVKEEIVLKELMVA